MLYKTTLSLTTLTVISLATPIPITNHNHLQDNELQEVIFLPYDVTYVPIELPIHTQIPIEETMVSKNFEKNKDALIGVNANTEKLDRESATYLGQEDFKGESRSGENEVLEIDGVKKVGKPPFGEEKRTGNMEHEHKLEVDVEETSSFGETLLITSEDYILVPVTSLKRSRNGEIKQKDKLHIVESAKKLIGVERKKNTDTNEKTLLLNENQYPDSLILIPVVALLRNSKQDVSESQKEDSSSTVPLSSLALSSLPFDKESHVISKRQAPATGLDGTAVVYRPVVQYRRVLRNKRRVFRPSRKNAFVGYLTDFDEFPTVA